jgi:hypothetical protein
MHVLVGDNILQKLTSHGPLHATSSYSWIADESAKVADFGLLSTSHGVNIDTCALMNDYLLLFP